MDFAVVQTPIVNEGSSTFALGRTASGQDLFIYGSGSKVMIFDDQFQLRQLLRTVGDAFVKAVAYDCNLHMIAAAFGDTVEIFALKDDLTCDGETCWKRSASFSCGFPVTALAWSCKNTLCVAGSSLALYRASTIKSNSASSVNLDIITWAPLLIQSLPKRSQVDRVEFSPNGAHLVTFQSPSDILKVWSFADADSPDQLRDDLFSLLGIAAQKLCMPRCAHSVAMLRHDGPIAGFSWSPISKFKQAHLLLTWTFDRMFTLWLPQLVDGLHGSFDVIRAFKGKAAWFEPEYPIRLNILNSRGKLLRFRIENFESPADILVDVIPEDTDLNIEKVKPDIQSVYRRSNNILLQNCSATKSIHIFDLIMSDTETSAIPTFRWSVSSDAHFPLQFVSPYNMLAASVFSGSKQVLDVCSLGAECSICDYIQVPFEADINALYWITSGHALVSTSQGCWILGFGEEPLVLTEKFQVHNRDGLIFVGMNTSQNLMAFKERDASTLQMYRIDFGKLECSVVGLVELDGGRFGFLQLLDFTEGSHIITGSDNLQIWQHFDMSYNCPEMIYRTTQEVRMARTSIFGDIALVSENHSSTKVDTLIIATPTAYEIHADEVFSEEHDTILAIKWVVVDQENFIRHLIVCSTTGLVIYTASLNDEFKETWHRIDLTSFPEMLAPPVPLGRSTISCNKFLDIWVTIDDMIAMWAPVEDSPVWDALKNALTPDDRTFAASNFFTELYSLLLNPDAAKERETPDTLDSSKLYDSLHLDEDLAVPKLTQSYDFSFFEDDSGLFSRTSSGFLTGTASPAAPSIKDANTAHQELGIDGCYNLDGPGRKFLLLNRCKAMRNLALDGLDFLCAYLSEAQDSILIECTKDASLGLSKFFTLGIPFWLKNKTKLGSLAEAVCRVEYSMSAPLEDIAPFYLLVGKRRALQALWKANIHGADPSSARIAQFLHHDFTQEVHRNIASKNAFASLSKQRHRLAIMFFLLADQYKDAILVALDTLKDLTLAFTIARLSDHEDLLLDLLEQRDGYPVCCLGILQSLVGKTEDVVGTCLELLRARPWNSSFAILPVITTLRLPSRHFLTAEEAEQSMRILLRQGSFDPALSIISLPHLDEIAEIKCHLSLLRLAASMASQRWKFFRQYAH